MENLKEIEKWLKEEVEFLVNNEEYNGGWLELGNGLGICVYWCDGFGKEARDDVIQAKSDSDYALVAGIKVIQPDDKSAGGPYYWNFPYYKNSGEVATEDVSIMPEEDYEELAKHLVNDYNSVKDLNMTEEGEIIEESLKESYPSFSELEEWCQGDIVEMIHTIERIRNNEMTDGDRLVYNDFGLEEYNEKELKKLLRELEDEVYSYLYNSGDFSEEQIDEIEKQLGESLKEALEDRPLSPGLTPEKYGSDVTEKVRKLLKLGYKPTDRVNGAGEVEVLNLIKDKEIIGKIKPEAERYFARRYDEKVIDKLIKELSKAEESLKEDNQKPLTKSPYKKLIGEYFEYTMDFDFLDIVANVLDRVDNFSNEDDIYHAVDDELIYIQDQWTILEFYCASPAEADWDSAYSDFLGDIMALASKIAEEQKEEEFDDEVEEF